MMKKKIILQKPLIALFGSMVLLIPAFRCSDERSEVENYTIASSDYSIMAEKSLDLLSSSDIDSWGTMLSDSVVYYFPDEKQTKLKGKAEVLSWWKNYLHTSGIKSMVIENASYLPVAVNVNTNAGPESLPGIHVIAYFSNKIVYEDRTTSLRMNFLIHFDKHKMIDGYYTYYDRSGL